MGIIEFPPKYQEPPFFQEIRKEGYHVYNLENAEEPNYYPHELPDYPGVSLKDLKKDDIITIRVFFGVGSGEEMRVDSGYLDLRVEFIDIDKVSALIITELPEEFVLSTGDSIDIFEEEILYIKDIQ
jgi:hypothetical protein